VSRRKVVLAGGGTGGHVLPLLAIAEALVDLGVDPEGVQLLASARGPDATLLDPTGFPVRYLPGRGLQRSLAPRALLDNARATLALLRALGQTVSSFRTWRPQVVVSAGGYAAFAAVAAAVLGRVPLVVVNLDAVPGLVHRIFGRFAVASCVGFSGTGLPHEVVTGAPLPKGIEAVARDPEARAAAKAELGVGPGPLVGIVGGSLGARSLNRAASELAPQLANLGCELLHVAGSRDFPALHQALEEGSQPPGYHLVEFERRMALLYTAADLVVARAGAMTVAELAQTRVPSILVPLPGAPGDHQTHNAEALVRIGGAVVIRDGELTGDRLAAELRRLLPPAEGLEEMAHALEQLPRTHAARAIAEEVLRHGG